MKLKRNVKAAKAQQLGFLPAGSLLIVGAKFYRILNVNIKQFPRIGMECCIYFLQSENDNALPYYSKRFWRQMQEAQ